MKWPHVYLDRAYSSLDLNSDLVWIGVGSVAAVIALAVVALILF